MGDKSGLFILPVLAAVFEFFLALFLLIFPASRRTAQIMLAASGIIFLIGLSVCSAANFNLHIQ
jgi:hypothetical protein